MQMSGGAAICGLGRDGWSRRRGEGLALTQRLGGVLQHGLATSQVIDEEGDLLLVVTGAEVREALLQTVEEGCHFPLQLLDIDADDDAAAVFGVVGTLDEAAAL